MIENKIEITGSINAVQKISGSINNQEQGLSAYGIALLHGFSGTEEEWLESLKGENGLSPTISVGTVTTLNSNENATVDNVGTKNNAIFNFGIPKGQDGSSESTNQYNELKNKPSINNVTLIGNKSLSDLNIQEKGNYALHSEIPTKTSDLRNDSNFVTEDYVTEAIENAEFDIDLSEYATLNDLDLKVDKVNGKGLSTNDYTTIEKNKLANIASGAQVNVNADWNSTSGDSQILNKPNIPQVPTNISAFNNDAGYLTSFTESDPTVPNHVKNITVQNISSWNNKSEFTGNYNDLSNKPTIPTKTSDLTNDSGYVTNLNSEIAIQDTEPTSEDTKIWINEDGVMRFKNENDEWQGTVSGGGSYEPIGSTKIYFGSTEPDGYKFANGQAISRETYSELFNLIGITYGDGDGSTTFNLPDMSGRVPVGLKVNTEWFARLGQTGGSETHTLTIEEMPSHNHTIGFDQTSGSDVSNLKSGTQSGYGMTTSNTGGGQAHSILQPYMTVNYIMKVKNIASEQTIVPDYVPIGTILHYDGTTVPDGYEEIEERETLLWTNPSPTSEMARNTTITLLNNNYDMYKIIYKSAVDGNEVFCSETIKGYGTSLIIKTGVNYITDRVVYYVDDTHLRFDGAYENNVLVNSKLIPLYVIGYKTNLFSEVNS